MSINISVFQVLTLDQLDKTLADQYLQLICDWERIEYGENKHRIPSQFAEWTEVNSKGVLCCVDEASILFGYADLWAIEDHIYHQLKLGLVLEEEIPSASLLPHAQFDKAINWYIASIITAPNIRHQSPAISKAAFRAIRYAVSDFFGKLPQYPAEVLAVGSSKKGQDLLTRWNFKPVKMAENPPDIRPRYQLDLHSAKDALFFRN